MKIKITFLGGVASSNLTGSSYVVSIRTGKKILKIMIDIGLVQGRHSDLLPDNLGILDHLQKHNLAPSTLDYIILTHSHIDHVGRLPLMEKNGFKGSIICTVATKRLLPAMLEDSAKVQAIENGHHKPHKKEKIQNARPLTRGKYDRVKNHSRGGPKTENVLYTPAEAISSTSRVKNGGYNYFEWIRLSHNVEAKLYPSGHVMGGAIIVLRIKDDKKSFHLCFSGDLGRRDGIILPPPAKIAEPIDAMVMESTYGGKQHPDRNAEIAKLKEIILKAAKERRRLIIPSFSFERSQEIFYLLCKMIQDGEIEPLEIYLDSPLGEKITKEFAKGWEEGMFADQADLNINPFDPEENKNLKVVGSREESCALTQKEDVTHVIVAGSGMCDAGRVRNHLRANLPNHRTTVCLVGYMADDTLGRTLKDRRHDDPFSVRMNGEEVAVKADIVCFDSFSAHADSSFLSEYARQTLAKDQKAPKQLFLVHGTFAGARDLKEEIEAALNSRRRKKTAITIPRINEVVTII